MQVTLNYISLLYLKQMHETTIYQEFLTWCPSFPHHSLSPELVMAFLAGRKFTAVAIIFCSLDFGSQSIKQVKGRAPNSCGKLRFICQT